MTRPWGRSRIRRFITLRSIRRRWCSRWYNGRGAMRSLVQFARLRAVFVWAAIVTGRLSLEAQATRDVSLTIQVTDISGAVIRGAHVTLVRGTTEDLGGC